MTAGVGIVCDRLLDPFTVRQAAGEIRKLDQVAAAVVLGQRANLKRIIKLVAIGRL
jgi:hypothetical protein